MDVEPESWASYLADLGHPLRWPAWACVAASLRHLGITGRRGLAFQFLCAAWYCALLLDLFGLFQVARSFLQPSG